jgi:hypothetical protein
LKAKSPRAASATLTVEPGVVGPAPTDHVSGSPSSSLPVTEAVSVPFVVGDAGVSATVVVGAVSTIVTESLSAAPLAPSLGVTVTETTSPRSPAVDRSKVSVSEDEPAVVCTTVAPTRHT